MLPASRFADTLLAVPDLVFLAIVLWHALVVTESALLAWLCSSGAFTDLEDLVQDIVAFADRNLRHAMLVADSALSAWLEADGALADFEDLVEDEVRLALGEADSANELFSGLALGRDRNAFVVAESTFSAWLETDRAFANLEDLVEDEVTFADRHTLLPDELLILLAFWWFWNTFVVVVGACLAKFGAFWAFASPSVPVADEITGTWCHTYTTNELLVLRTLRDAVGASAVELVVRLAHAILRPLIVNHSSVTLDVASAVTADSITSTMRPGSIADIPVVVEGALEVGLAVTRVAVLVPA